MAKEKSKSQNKLLTMFGTYNLQDKESSPIIIDYNGLAAELTCNCKTKCAVQNTACEVCKTNIALCTGKKVEETTIKPQEETTTKPTEETTKIPYKRL